MLPTVNMTPVMAVRVRTVQMSAILRVNLSPVLDDLPFIGGIALSFMTQPYLDFDLRFRLAQPLRSAPMRHARSCCPCLYQPLFSVCCDIILAGLVA